jgi:hypothetical protein
MCKSGFMIIRQIHINEYGFDVVSDYSVYTDKEKADKIAEELNNSDHDWDLSDDGNDFYYVHNALIFE